MGNVLLGTGDATGMFYHAPKGTKLPEYPAEELSAAWKQVGDVSDAGITLATSKTTANIKNWANQVVRVTISDHAETIQAPVIDTTLESLKTVLGENNVNVIPATEDHGELIRASLSAGSLPAEEAYLFIMKDGDNMIAIGCEDGQIQSIDNNTFAANSAITWNPTITALGEGWVFILDDGFKLIPELKSISITTAPTKTNYNAGENFDRTGMVVTAVYSNGSTANVDTYTVSPSENLSSSDTEVIISYTENGVTKTVTQAIMVAEPVLESISVAVAPTKLDYSVGEDFDSTGMVITASYSDGSTSPITGYTVTPDTNLATTDTEVTISYTEDGVTKTVTQAITVTE